MTLPIITALTAGIILVLQQVLMFSVGFHRISTSRGVGFGDDVDMERLIRRHGNLAENSAIFLVVLGLLEMIGTGSGVITGFAVVFVVARFAHAIGFSFLGGSHGGDYTQGGVLAIACRAGGATTSGLAGLAAGVLLAYSAFVRLGV